MLKCKIVGRNNETWYDIAEGAVFTENYNETLDSGHILIQQLPAEIEIEPYDIAIIESYGDGLQINSRRMCVDTVTCTQVSLVPPLFKYDISLFSETKLLEGIICPNLAITKLATDTPRSVSYYLEQYLNLYSPKLYSDEFHGAYTNKFFLPDETKQRFSNAVCPEMQWNQPTLREVLSDLMMVDDCIPVLRDNRLEYIDISEIGEEIDDDQKSYINYITKTHSSEDYVSDIKMHLVNAANNSTPTGEYGDIDDSDIPSDITRIVEKIGFRNDDSYLLTTENMRLQTSFPIWKLFYCRIEFYVRCEVYYLDASSNRFTDYQWFHIGMNLKDSTVDYIPEHQKWLTKDVYYGSWGVGAGLSSNYRNTCLYYTRGQKNIENFNDKQDAPLLFIPNSIFVFDLIKSNSAILDDANEQGRTWFESHYPDTYEYIGTSYDPAQLTYKTAVFEVAYEAIDDSVFSATKSPFPRNYRQIIDNQTNSYVDTNRQGFLEYLKANRLGNKMLQINGRFQCDESDMPDLAQKINGHIIFMKQISVYDKHIDVNYQATANYVLKDYFTGVRSKIRSWRVVSGSEALVRTELVKFYINSDIPSVSNNNRVIPSYASLDTYFEKFKFCAMRFDDARPPRTKYSVGTYETNVVMVEFTKHRVGKSVVFTIKMPDNYYIGNYVSNYDGTDDRVEQKGIAYADENGEVVSCVILFYEEYQPYGFSTETVNRALKPLTNAGLYPDDHSGTGLNSDHMVAKIPMTVFKDNKEILQISVQFELNEDANDMFLGYK